MTGIKYLSGVLLLAFLSAGSTAWSQEEESTEFHPYRVTLMMANAHVPSGLSSNGGPKWLVLSNWGLDFDYWFNRHWALSFQTDIVVENFTVAAFNISDREFLERSYPVSLALVGIYSFDKHISVLAGAGVDIAIEETFPLLRLGFEYGWELNEFWGVGLSLIYDHKIEGYDTWTFGVSASRRF